MKKEEQRQRDRSKRPTGERPNCDCESQAQIYTASGLAQLGNAWRNRRIRVEVTSKVQCDPDTKQCLYTYTATASVQKLVNSRWRADAGRRAYVRSFEVHDSVNESITSERIDRTVLTVVTWNPNSPLKESTEVTLALAPATQSGHRIDIEKRKVTLCVPTGAVAACP